MRVNPLLRRLGLDDDDRVVIIHVDDIGNCQATMDAWDELWAAGTVSSGSVMVPCPWFPAAAAWARRHPEADLGLHATLNAEWSGYRWAPISTTDPASGLMDDEGYFPRRQPAIWERADEAAVWREVEAQLRRAAAAGIAPTHIDTHMLTLCHERFLPGFVSLLRRELLPGMVLHEYLDVGTEAGQGISPAAASAIADFLAEQEANSFPLIDNIDFMPLNMGEGVDEQLDVLRHKLNALTPGTITHFAIHPSKDTPELRAMTGDWRARVGNYRLFSSRQARDLLRDSGLQIIGYRPLLELMRA